jgi:hypothetical protein
MKYINFVVGAVAWVQYFMPIVIEGQKRGIPSNFFIRGNPKGYANLYVPEHFNQIKKTCEKYHINMYSISEIGKFSGLTFLMEGDISGTSAKDYESSGLLQLNKSHLKVSFTFNADFIWSYEKYINLVDYVVLPGKTYETAYKIKSPKNVFLGSPKFDIVYDSDAIYKKFKLNKNNRHLIFFFPKKKWISSSPKLKDYMPKMKYLIDQFKKMGYKIIIKTREKDRITEKLGDYYFEEIDLYPNSSIELLYICKLAVFFSSATIEECVMLSVPFIDFKVDAKFDRFAFLHDPSYSRIIDNLEIPYGELQTHVKSITMPHIYNPAFQKARLEHMFVNNNVSANILNRFEKEADAICENTQTNKPK